MNCRFLSQLVGRILVAAIVFYAQSSLAVCGYGDDELPFFFKVDSFSYSQDTSGAFRLGATKITYASGTSTWISTCNASDDPNKAAAIAGASKSVYLSLRAYHAPLDNNDTGVEIARSPMFNVHVWDPAPAFAGYVGYGGDYASPSLQPQQTLAEGRYFLSVYFVESANNVAWLFYDVPQIFVVGNPPPLSLNYEGLWWNSPAESESGWGINLAHQGDSIFATWFTYDLTGKAWWLSMTAQKTGDGVYSGALVQTRGPAFNAVPFNPSAVTRSAVGTGTLTFTDARTGTFAYTVNGASQTKTIIQQAFGTIPTCAFAAQPDLTAATNYQDLWYASPAESESGWGVNFTHQGDNIFATWFTYNLDGSPLWLSALISKTAPGVYSGPLVLTTGPAFNAVPFDPTKVTRTGAGTLTVTFSNGNNATFAYTVMLPGSTSAVTQTKQITRQAFGSPRTVCQ